MRKATTAGAALVTGIIVIVLVMLYRGEETSERAAGPTPAASVVVASRPQAPSATRRLPASVAATPPPASPRLNDDVRNVLPPPLPEHEAELLPREDLGPETPGRGQKKYPRNFAELTQEQREKFGLNPDGDIAHRLVLHDKLRRCVKDSVQSRGGILFDFIWTKQGDEIVGTNVVIMESALGNEDDDRVVLNCVSPLFVGLRRTIPLKAEMNVREMPDGHQIHTRYPIHIPVDASVLYAWLAGKMP